LISDGQQINGCCILRSLVFDEREPSDTGIGDVWKLNFKTIGLIVSPPGINIYDYGPICENIPNNCLFVTLTYEMGILDLHTYLHVPSSIPKTLYIRRHRFRVMPSEAATSYFYQGSTITYPNPIKFEIFIQIITNLA